MSMPGRIRRGISRRLGAVKWKLRNMYAIRQDKKRGVDFYTVVSNEGTPEALAGNHIYQATSLLYGRDVREYLCKQDHTDDRVIDVGCGKGRMLELFTELGFAKADGLEYSPELSEIARKNMKTLGLPCQVFTGDAALFDGYDAYNWFYLFNPFNEKVMRKFIGKLEESLRRNPRAITVLYINPTCEKVFADAGFHMEMSGRENRRICLITNKGMAEGAPEA